MKKEKCGFIKELAARPNIHHDTRFKEGKVAKQP